MMERRLKLAKRLLNPKKSVLIVTIDEKEQPRLGLLLEQVFSSSRIQMVSVNIHPSGVARSEFSRSDEYYFFVFIGDASPNAVTMPDVWLDDGVKRQSSVRWESLLRSGNNGRRTDRPNLFYPVLFDKETKDFIGFGDPVPIKKSGVEYKAPEGSIAILPYDSNGNEACWRISASKAYELKKIGAFDWSEFKDGKTALKYLKPGELQKIERGEYEVIGYKDNGAMLISSDNYEAKWLPSTQWHVKSHDAGIGGSRLLKTIFLEKRFDFPKSLYAVEDAIRFFVKDNPDALIIDFFAGSGTTAHAVMRLNHQDNGNRKSISITNNEVGEEEAKALSKKELRQGDPEWEAFGICEYITKPRVNAAITGKTPEGKPIKGDYKFVDEFPMADGFEENAIFFDLTYEDEMTVELDMAFEKVAPILWLKAGQEGRCIDERKQDYDIADTYAVLFDYRYSQKFIDALQETDKDKLRIVYVVTDQDSRFQDVAQQLPEGIEPVRLYESYLRTFKINQSEG